MRVITLENITKYVADKHGNQTVSKVNTVNGKTVFIIHDENTECPEVKLSGTSGMIYMEGNKKGVHCILTETLLHDIEEEHPFIKCREAIGGQLIVDGRVPTEDELRKYMYKV